MTDHDEYIRRLILGEGEHSSFPWYVSGVSATTAHIRSADGTTNIAVVFNGHHKNLALILTSPKLLEASQQAEYWITQMDLAGKEDLHAVNPTEILRVLRGVIEEAGGEPITENNRLDAAEIQMLLDGARFSVSNLTTFLNREKEFHPGLNHEVQKDRLKRWVNIIAKLEAAS